MCHLSTVHSILGMGAHSPSLHLSLVAMTTLCTIYIPQARGGLNEYHQYTTACAI